MKERMRKKYQFSLIFLRSFIRPSTWNYYNVFIIRLDYMKCEAIFQKYFNIAVRSHLFLCGYQDLFSSIRFLSNCCSSYLLSKHVLNGWINWKMYWCFQWVSSNTKTAILNLSQFIWSRKIAEEIAGYKIWLQWNKSSVVDIFSAIIILWNFVDLILYFLVCLKVIKNMNFNPTSCIKENLYTLNINFSIEGFLMRLVRILRFLFSAWRSVPFLLSSRVTSNGNFHIIDFMIPLTECESAHRILFSII
jgi:hypothetical protein